LSSSLKAQKYNKYKINIQKNKKINGNQISAVGSGDCLAPPIIF